MLMTSCAKNDDEQPSPDKAKLDNLKNLFELVGGKSALPNPLFSQPSRASNYSYEELMTYPVWEQTTISDDDNLIFYYVPVEGSSSTVYYFNIEQSLGAITMSNTAIAQPISRIIGIFDKQSEQTAFMITTAIPDSTYTLCSDYPLIDFSGVYLYSSLEGKPILGVEYKCGDIINYLIFDRETADEYERDIKAWIGIGTIAEEQPASRAISKIQKIEAVECFTKRPPQNGAGGGGFDSNLIDTGGAGSSMDPFFKDRKNPFPIPTGYPGPASSGKSRDTGGGAGSSVNSGMSTPTSTPEETAKKAAPEATKIFDPKSKLLDKDWEKIERLIEKIMIDCMGGNLYNGLFDYLGGKTFKIQLDAKVSGSSFSGSTITLNSMESNKLFHEMFHAYQAYGETLITYNNATANLEVEANIAQYRYLSKLSIPDSPDWNDVYVHTSFGKKITDLSERLDPNGKLPPNSKSNEFRQAFSNAAQETELLNPFKYYFDASRDNSKNTANIQNLTKNCKP